MSKKHFKGRGSAMSSRAIVAVVILFAILCKCGSTQETVTEEIAQNTLAETVHDEGVESTTTTSTTPTTRKWISEIFDEVQENFRMYADVSESCRNDFTMYQRHLKNQTIWAIRMMESSEWPRLGLFSGVTTVLGDWSECLSVRSPKYQGQYCLVDAVYDYSFVPADPLHRGWDRHPNQNSSVWGVIKMYDNIITRQSRRNLTWALCIPSSCTADDLRVSIMNAAAPIFRKYDMDFVANVESRTCRVEESKPFSKGFLYTFYFLIFLAAVVLLATYYDYKAHILPKRESKEIVEDSYVAKAFYSFSALESWKCLTNAAPSTIYPLYFAKSLMFFLIISAHEGMLAIPFPKIEQEQTEMLFQPWQIPFGFHCVVDIFVGISGFLTFHFGYEPTKKGGILYFIGAIACRWIRLIPVMGLYILVYVFMAPEIGDGPLWNKRMLYDVQCCRSNWWTNMLAVQNIVNRQDLCMPQTWYIAVDFQLTIVGTALLVILAKNFTLGIISMVFTFLAGIFVHFYLVYVNQFSGLPTPAIYEMEIMRKQPFFSDLYIQMYSRIGPYMVGFTGALVLMILKDRKYHPSGITCALLVIVTGFIGIGSNLYGFLFTIFNRPYDPIEHATYGALTRTLIAVPMICIIVVLGLRRMGWFSYILEWKIFLVLGRLAYVVYLSSFSIQFLRYSAMRQLLIGSGMTEMIHGIMTDVLLTAIVAGFLYGLAEGPLHNLTVILQIYVYDKMREADNRQSKAVKQRYYDDVLAQKYLSNGKKIFNEDMEV